MASSKMCNVVKELRGIDPGGLSLTARSIQYTRSCHGCTFDHHIDFVFLPFQEKVYRSVKNCLFPRGLWSWFIIPDFFEILMCDFVHSDEFGRRAIMHQFNKLELTRRSWHVLLYLMYLD